jgi:hypothetical protein
MVRGHTGACMYARIGMHAKTHWPNPEIHVYLGTGRVCLCVGRA